MPSLTVNMLLKIVLLVFILGGLVFLMASFIQPNSINIIGAIGAALSNAVATVLIGKP